jgi:Zn-dependent protease with chaperone function
MGHYVLGHILRGVAASFVGILLAFFVGFHIFQFLLRRFGARWRIPSQEDWAAVVIMFLVMTVITFFAEPIGNTFSRSMEHDADVFGQEVVHGIVADPQGTGQASFQLLGENQVVNPNPSAFIEFWTDSHPSIPFRAAFAKHYDPWAPGAEPKYFKK